MRVLSGIQPTGPIHWGNYFGAIRQYIALQNNEQAFYFIANLHALTTVRDRDKFDCKKKSRASAPAAWAVIGASLPPQAETMRPIDRCDMAILA